MQSVNIKPCCFVGMGANPGKAYCKFTIQNQVSAKAKVVMMLSKFCFFSVPIVDSDLTNQQRIGANKSLNIIKQR